MEFVCCFVVRVRIGIVIFFVGVGEVLSTEGGEEAHLSLVILYII